MKHSSVPLGSDAAFLGTTNALRAKLHEVLTALDDLPSKESMPIAQSCHLTERDVRAILKARRNRSQYFPGDLFADPAWDILLELYAAELGQRRIAISSLCIGAAVPATTALRWINTLEQKGLISRQNDPFDGRRVYARLSESGLTSIDAYFANTPFEVPSRGHSRAGSSNAASL